ncbi:MAG: aminopeptidase P family protein [Chloroflexi bacterium]|nr:aminopeptidase P family protein [Chloroflexota bacterium]
MPTFRPFPRHSRDVFVSGIWGGLLSSIPFPSGKGQGLGVPIHHRSSARLVQTGDLVTMTCGVLYAGYESDVGRTWLCAPAKANSKQRSLHKRWLDTYQAMLKECRPGRTAADLRKAAENTVRPEPHSSVRGEPIARPEASRREPRSWTPPAPVAHAVGLGFEPPIAGSDLGAEAESRMTLQAGMVLVLQPYIWEAGIGGYLAKETVLVTKAAPQRLSTLPYGPLA